MMELQNPWWLGEPDRDWEAFEKLTYRTVSYTHLTLPTICSV